MIIKILSSWYKWYCHHHKAHECNMREAASWAWWNIWNPTIGKTIFRNCWLSSETIKQLNDKEKEWHDIFSQAASRSHILEKKWNDFNRMKVDDYLKRAKEDNKDTIKNLQKKIKKVQKSEKKA